MLTLTGTVEDPSGTRCCVGDNLYYTLDIERTLCDPPGREQAHTQDVQRVCRRALPHEAQNFTPSMSQIIFIETCLQKYY